MKTIQKRKVIIKVPAKINLTLDVLGKDEKFHFLKSLVSSINVYDIISLEKREDDQITLSIIGDCGCKIEDNTAYKAAKLFKEKFSVGGVDITINKNIPLGAGLGGSSADIAGVLNGMKLLFRKRGDLLPLANELGSDSGFMLGGGIAVIQGRGDIICRQKLKLSANILLVTEESSISAKESYNAYDKIGKTYDSTTDQAVTCLANGDKKNFYSLCKNDLYEGSKGILPKIKDNILALEKAGASVALMTGSGSAVYGIFSSAKKRNDAYSKLLPIYQDRLIKAKTTL